MTWLRGLPQRLRDRFLRWANRPEPRRVDHDRMYVWVHIGLILVGIGIAARPYNSGALSDLSVQTNRALALCMVIGSSICLAASLTRLPDVRIPYVVGGGGQISVVVSLTVWTYQIQRTSDIIGTLSGGLAIVILCACVHFGVVAVKEIVRVTRAARKVA